MPEGEGVVQGRSGRGGKVAGQREDPLLQVGQTWHVVAQFSPQRVLLAVDGQVRAEFKDPQWIAGLDTVSLMNGFGRDWVDNVRIYQAQP